MPRPPRPHRSDDQGMTLVEVLVALAILAIVLPSLAGLMFTTLRATQTGDQRTVASNLAQSELERVRSLPFETIAVPGRTTPVARDTASGRFLVARDTTWASVDATTDPCTQPIAAGATALLRIDVEVWPESEPARIVRTSTTVARPPVSETGPTNTGVLAVRVTDGRLPPGGVAGVPVTVTGPGGFSRAQTSPGSGCVLFLGVPAGTTYTVTVSRPGYVGRDLNDGAAPTRQASVSANTQSTVEIGYDRAAALTLTGRGRPLADAARPTSLPVTMSRDELVLRSTAGQATGSLWPTTWSIWAGSCEAADPTVGWGATRQSVTLTAGNASTAEVDLGVTRLTVPATVTVPVTWPVTVTATSTDTGCEASLDFVPIGPEGPVTSDGAADLALPFGRWRLTAVDATGRPVADATTTLDARVTDVVAAIPSVEEAP